MRKKFQEMQDRFSQEFIIDLNATQAAIRAGYSTKSAKSKGSQLLTLVNVQNKIQKLQAKRSKRTDIKADSIIQELAKVAFSNIQDFLTVDKDGEVYLLNFDAIEREKLAVIESIKVSTTKTHSGENEKREYTTTQFKLHSKLNALEQLGKHLGIFKESAPHPEREKARRALQETERKALNRLARRRTLELSNEN